MKKICGFYASDIHFIVMLLPFIKEKIKNHAKIETFFQQDYKESIDNILNKLIANEKNNEEILNINWKAKKINKYSNIENKLKNILNKNDEIIFLISGNKKYIKETNNLLDKLLEKYNTNNINIINCFSVEEFDDDIKEVLDNHEYIINTSGVHRIDEVFEDYKKIKIN